MARVRHSLRWRSVGAAATFLVAVAVGMAGIRLTGRVAPALVVFGVLVTGGVLVTYMVDRYDSARGSADEGAEGAAGSQAGPTDLRDTQRVQIGNHNWQQNYFDAELERGRRNEDPPTA